MVAKCEGRTGDVKVTASPVSERLRKAGLRPTQQRVVIGEMLWPGPGTRHVEASALHDDLTVRGIRVSLATVYNALRDFERAGLLRRIAVASDRLWFDTDTGDHQHFHIEAENRLFDLPVGWQLNRSLPPAPAGYSISHIDVVVHLKKDS